MPGGVAAERRPATPGPKRMSRAWAGLASTSPTTCRPTKRYVRIATGRDHREAMPVSGIRLGQSRGTACDDASPWSSNPALARKVADSDGILMTYCVGLKIDRGLVFMSDTRTNAGIDCISTFRKMHIWAEPGERVIVLMSAGNLATTQAVVSLLDERTKAVAERSADPARDALDVPDGAAGRRHGARGDRQLVAGRPEGRFLLQCLVHPRRPDPRHRRRACS